MKSIQFITIVLLITISLKSNGQDIHFSQFWNSPLLQNPSFAGNSEGDIRAIVNHRSQWGEITSNPYKTFGVNFDMRINTSSKDNYFAGGVSMYTDVAGSSNMRTTLANLATAYHFKINSQNYFSGGLQAGLNQKSINENDLRFDNQYDGTGHNSSLNSNENLSSLSELKPTVSAGISYMWSNAFGRTTNRTIQGKKSFNIGLAVHHFNSPQFNFANQENLGLKYILSFEGDFKTSSSPWVIQPAAFVATQNKATNFVFGSLFKYAFNEGSRITDFRKSASIAFGGYYRLKDAVIPTIQIQWISFDLGLSYDVNLSQLSGASNGRGGFEISLKYISQQPITGRKSKARFF